MPHGYSDSKPYDAENLEDEFLCEYVDGTMDPLVRHVFEEYVRGNPGMEEHIERLRSTRKLLCRYACSCRAPSDLHHRLRNRIPAEAFRPAPHAPATVREAAKETAALSSYAISIILMLGLVLGASGGGVESDRAPSSPAASPHARPAPTLSYAGDMLRRSSYPSVLHPLIHFSRDRAYPWLHARSIVTASVKRELRTRKTPDGAMVSEVVHPR